MAYTVVALDLDNTLLNNDGRLSETNAKAVKRVEELGADIVICTGRMPSCIFPIEKQLGINCYVVAYNGAVAFRKQQNGERKILFNDFLDPERASDIISFAIQLGFNVNFYYENKIYNVVKNDSQKLLVSKYIKLTSAEFEIVENYDFLRGEKVAKLAVLVPEERVNDIFDKIVARFGDDMHAIKGDFYVELLNKGINKGTALAYVLNDLGKTPEETVGFGDGNNDAEYLTCVGKGIAMKNASELCKSSADYVSEWTNDENAVAREINILIEKGLIKSS